MKSASPSFLIFQINQHLFKNLREEEGVGTIHCPGSLLLWLPKSLKNLEIIELSSCSTWYIQGFGRVLACWSSSNLSLSGQLFGLISSFLSNRHLQEVLDGKSLQDYPVNAAQASAYELCDGTRMPLRTPKTLETCKKKYVLIDSKSFKVCGRSHT